MEIKEYINEVWKPIRGYVGLYECSNFGRVRSVRTQHILKFSFTSYGYHQVTLSKNGVTKTHTVHRLVAEAFIPNHLNLPCVDHINGVKTDNRVENLRWVSYAGNYHNPNTIKNQHRWVKGHVPHNKGVEFKQIRGEKHPRHIPVIQYTKDGLFVKEWVSASEVQRELGISQSAISACCNGRYGFKTAGGFIWKYKKGVAA